jgi:uncharacterized protein YbaR (Trm112 family)
MPLSPEILKIICCPKCKGDLEYKKDKEVLICKSCELVYKIEDDIPIMLIDEAIPLKDFEKNESY